MKRHVDYLLQIYKIKQLQAQYLIIIKTILPQKIYLRSKINSSSKVVWLPALENIILIFHSKETKLMNNHKNINAKASFYACLFISVLRCNYWTLNITQDYLLYTRKTDFWINSGWPYPLAYISGFELNPQPLVHQSRLQSIAFNRFFLYILKTPVLSYILFWRGLHKYIYIWIHIYETGRKNT